MCSLQTLRSRQWSDIRMVELIMAENVLHLKYMILWQNKLKTNSTQHNFKLETNSTQHNLKLETNITQRNFKLETNSMKQRQ
jgi:hypothetical protein